MRTFLAFGLTLLALGTARAQAPLTLDQLLAQVEQSFPKLIGAAAEVEVASAKRRSKQGAFDPVLSTTTETMRYNSASSRGKASYGSTNELGVELATPLGVKLAAGRAWNVGSVKSPDSSTGSAGNYFLYVKAPLGRGSGGLNEKAVLLAQAQLGEPAAAENLRLVRQGVLLEAALAYYEWSGASEKRQIADNLLAVAQSRAAFVQREIAEKQRPAIDGIEADAEVERRRASQFKALRDQEKAALKLSKFLWGENSTLVGAAPALDIPEPWNEESLPQALGQAQAQRPELRMLALQLESLTLDARLAQADLRPTVDLVFSPGTDLGNKGVGATFKAGVTAAIPLYQREAKGRLTEAEQKRLKVTRERELTERVIELEVRDAASAVRRATERYQAAQQSYLQNRRVEEGELIRFREGDSTLFLVNQRERATAEAASLVVDIQVEYAQARAAFRAAAMGF